VQIADVYQRTVRRANHQKSVQIAFWMNVVAGFHSELLALDSMTIILLFQASLALLKCFLNIIGIFTYWRSEVVYV
jgi:hypothetical protein